MTKFLLLTFMFIFGAAKGAGITRAEFVHMSEANQDAYIISIMQLMTDLEAQHKKDVRAGNVNSEYFRRYSQLLFKLQSFIISDAHAAVDPWDTTAARYVGALKGAQPGSVCIFAGWPSSMGSNGMCTHPSRGKNSSLYQGSCGADKVSCNPTIFGYKKADTHSLFCVTAKDDAKNSALNCMQEALKQEETPEADSAEKRLKFLREHLASNKEVVDEVYKFSSQICLCDAPPVKGSQVYGEKIRVHRTCYGLMNMLAQTAESCNLPSAPALKADIFMSLKNKIAETPEFDSAYAGFRELLKKDHASDFKNLCGSDPAVNVGGGNTGGDNGEGDPEIVVTAENCTATCAPADGDKPRSCTFKVNGKETTSVAPVTFTEGKASITLNRVYPALEPGETLDDEEKALRAKEGPTRALECKIADSDKDTKPDAANKPKLILKVTSKNNPASVELTSVVTGPKLGTTKPDTTTTETVAADSEIDAEVTWYYKENSTQTVETEKPKPITGEVGAGFESTDRAPAEDKPAPEKPKPPVNEVPEDNLGVGKTMTANMLIDEVEVCAVATKEGYENSDEKCQKIPKLKVAGPTMPGMQPMLRSGQSVIHGGIR